ncbi:uncharacterized protein SPAPADRAFT_60442 [Spathaspora passalidarum NRRL Y-27907]|uniref:Uncharacterized protein n=1 Tax=Spathaspora passalidarum (strain NRRL Y-27907 / 11-Y1) TaxID=619300 RepID=G3AL88_SPAPN|nr:uncharacterized protein SPAPADRAFT_60442 [Spathaspora passalidarum NRRL Y-27907]EGW33131.1 hypothetical protein SPAPADRAFT_60442 [Spathaspora passalidarum NRRL Y-27907]
MGFDDILKKGEQFVKDGNITSADVKDAYQNYESSGGDVKKFATETYAEYKINHSGDKKSDDKKDDDKKN